MDEDQLTVWKRNLRGLPSRRDVLLGLAGVGLSLSALRLGDVAEAKQERKGKKTKKKHKNRRQPQPQSQPRPRPPLDFNRYGCIEVGQPCRGDDSLCCSGICQGAAPAGEFDPDTSRCVAHDSGTCDQTLPGFCRDSQNPLNACNNAGSKNCFCFRTTAGSDFCGWLEGETKYADCKRDADCLALGLPAGSACVPTWEGACSGSSEIGMTCMVPCPWTFPPA